MAKRESKRTNDECALDMTPMIDVVFQLIIFFVVTLKTSQTINQDIILEHGKNGPVIEQKEIPPLVVEVDRHGWISIGAAQLSEGHLRNSVRNRVARHGPNFPLYIRADKRAQHKDVKRVMDICAQAGVWNVSFMAMVKKAGE